MKGYYDQKLAGKRLERCYEVAPPRVRQYLEKEILHVLGRLGPTDVILELGCGYGRIVRRLAAAVRRVIGIDTTLASLELARREKEPGACEFAQMDAVRLGFADESFDAVLCLQNGVCAFGVQRVALLHEALRVVRPGGQVLLSTYADGIWPERLAWFEAQAAAGLVGEVDADASGDGVIACRDGFRVGRLTADDFRALAASCGVTPAILEVDGSSLFCEIVKPGGAPHSDAPGRAERRP